MKYFNCTKSNIEKLIKQKKKNDLTIGIALPVLNEEKTIGRTLDVVRNCRELIDQVVVMDSNSSDNSKKIVESKGVDFVPDFTASKDLKTKLSRGKGWNLWSSLYYLKTDIIIWIDSDIQNFDKRFIIGMAAPFIIDSEIKFVKGYYHRPKGDARVTEIMVRPFSSYFFPKITDFIQPLSGEYAGRRDFLENIGFYSGYSVEMAVLLEASDKLNTNQIAQSYLGKRVHELQDVQSLGKMSASILWTIIDKAEKNNTLKTKKNNNGLLRQFHSKNGDKFKPVDFKIKDTELKAIKQNRVYASKFK